MGMLGSVRNQTLLPEQRIIFDYWRQQCLSKGLPSYEDIDPLLIKSHLPTVSLTEVSPSEHRTRYKIRLAGTGLYNYFEQEITGHYLDELPCGERTLYWERIYDAIRKTGRPRIGVTRPGTPSGAHMYQFWIRMPLSCDGNKINMILGFDKFMKGEQLRRDLKKPNKIAI